MTHIVAGAAFAGFVIASVVVSLVPSRRSRNALILYTVGVTGLAVVSQHDLWPFSAWRLMVGPAPSAIGDDVVRVRITLIGSDGLEYPLDHRAIEPLDLGELRGWIRQNLSSASPEVLDGMCSFLLDASEVARERVMAGRHPGHFARVLGPVTSPKHALYPDLWSSPEDVPDGPFRAVEIQQEYWDLEARRRDGRAIELRPLHRCERDS